ncbi:MAG: hypothetical protein KIS66_11285 [Fimbriimonadaceae bacterium]|nr:hypothetical protein [Fimbriimonadaceae bacterium]
MNLSRIPALGAALAIALASSALGQATKQPRQESDPRSAIGGLLVSPTIFREFVNLPGTKRTLKLKVECPNNATATATEGKLDIKSFMPDDWTYKTKLDVKHDRDCSQWFTKRYEDMTLRPTEKRELQLNYVVPREAEGTYWAMIQFRPRPVGADQGAAVIYEIPIILTVKRAQKPEVTFSTPELMPVPGGPGRFQARIAMTSVGNTFVPIGMTATVRDLNRNGRVVDEESIEDRNLLPGTKRHLAVVMGGINDGRYRLTVRVDLGRRRIPPLVADYVVQQGKPVPASEAVITKQIPVIIDPEAKPFGEVAAGGQRVQAMKIINQSNKPISLALSTRCLEQSSGGSIGIGEAPVAAGLALDIRPTELSLAPGRTGVVILTARLDRNAKGDYWFGVEVKDREDPKGLAEVMMANIVVKGTTQPGMTVDSPELVTDNNGRPVTVRYMVTNSGNMALRPQAEAIVLEGGLRRVAALEVPLKGDGGMIPGARIPNLVMLPPDLKPGSYTVDVVYRYGDDLSATLSVPIKVPEAKAAPKPPAAKPNATSGKPKPPVKTGSKAGGKGGG